MHWIRLPAIILRYRSTLSALIRDPRLQSNTIFEWDGRAFKNRGLDALLLDFDGVLAPHKADQPDPVVIQWLKNTVQDFPQERIWIFSNAPTAAREAYFRAHFPKIRWLKPPPKKPDPQLVLEWLHQQGLHPQSVLLVDDRLLTGILCALLSGVHPLWIRQPFRYHPQASWRVRWAERWIECLRRIEHCLLK